jgi:type VI secretion system secreted protein Hcp
MEATVSARRFPQLQFHPAVLLFSAGLFLIIPTAEVIAQEGDPDQPMIVGVVPGPVAAVDMFIKFDGVDGESKDDKHDKWIDVLSVDWGNTSSRGTDGRPQRMVRPRRGERAGDAEIKSLTLTKSYDAASVNLMKACAEGTHFPSVLIEMTTSQEEGSRFMKVELDNVIVSSYSMSGGEGSVPTESVTLNFSKFEYAYIKEHQRGKTDASWKVEEGER